MKKINTRYNLNREKAYLIALKNVHQHVWFKISEELKCCPECDLTLPVAENEQLIDISFYFYENDDTQDKIDTLMSTYNHIKRCNPDHTSEELQQTLWMHLTQLRNEKRAL